MLQKPLPQAFFPRAWNSQYVDDIKARTTAAGPSPVSFEEMPEPAKDTIERLKRNEVSLRSVVLAAIEKFDLPAKPIGESTAALRHLEIADAFLRETPICEDTVATQNDALHVRLAGAAFHLAEARRIVLQHVRQKRLRIDAIRSNLDGRMQRLMRPQDSTSRVKIAKNRIEKKDVAAVMATTFGDLAGCLRAANKAHEPVQKLRAVDALIAEIRKPIPLPAPADLERWQRSFDVFRDLSKTQPLKVAELAQEYASIPSTIDTLVDPLRQVSLGVAKAFVDDAQVQLDELAKTISCI